MNYTSVLVLAALFVAGCSTHESVVREITSGDEWNMNYDQANEELEGTKARLVLADGSVCEAEDVRLGKDTTFFMDWTHPLVKRIPTSSIVLLQAKKNNELWTCDLSRMKERESDIQRINDVLEGTRVSILLADGKKFDAQDVRLGTDATVFADRSQPGPHGIPTRTIVTIKTRSHLEGAVEGFFLGLVGGGAFGYGLGRSTVQDSEDSGNGDSIWLFLTTSGGGLLGSVGGVTYGAIHGHTTEYTIVHQALQISK